MNVLLLNPPFLENFSRPQRSPAVTKSGTLYFPLWLSYATGVLEKNGYTVDLIDAPADGHDFAYVLERSRKLSPDLIVLDTSTPSIYNDVEIAGRLKDEFPKSFIVLVGTHVSALPEQTLKIDARIDAVTIQEYDYTLLDLANALDRGGELKEVKGLCFQKDGQITRNEPREYIEDLDEIPFVSSVYKKFLKIENYFNPNALFPMVTITASRGCPFPCTFCVYPQTLMGRRFRCRSAENVVEEMEYITKNFPQAKAIFFEDDTLTVNKSMCRELADIILKKGLKISWNANSRIGLDLETMKLMKKAGCRSLCVGFESGSQKILDNMKKKTKIDQMEEFMANAKKAGILVHGCFMVGLPEETKETLQETLDLAIRLEPDTVQFYPIMVYPGTEAYDWYEKNGLITADDFSKWITPEGLHNTVIKLESLSSHDLVAFCDMARRKFYLRPSYVLFKLKQMITHPAEIKRTVKSARTFFKYLVFGSDA